jgi:tRNA(Ile)-lysidine synthase
MDLKEYVRRIIVQEEMLTPGDRVLIGVSGGIDSSALLFILRSLKDTLGIQLAVAHVNHQLRGEESERDESFVGEAADRYGLVCHTTRADVLSASRSRGISIQHAGRDIRYKFFSDLAVAHNYNRIAIAHNQDDQVETFLLRVIKGTGLNGLSSIPIKRGAIIRPFLTTCRTDIEVYVQSASIQYVEDSSNRKDGYERNFVRNRITPLIAQLNPSFRDKVVSLLSDISALNERLDAEAREFLETRVTIEDGENSVSVEKLRALSEEVRFRVVSDQLIRLRPEFVPLREHIRLVDKSLFSTRPNNFVVLPRGIRVKRAYDSLIFSRQKEIPHFAGSHAVEPGKNIIPELKVIITLAFHNEQPSLSGEDRMVAVLDADKIADLTVRTFRTGDRFVPLGMGEQTKLKDFFISRKIPQERRRSIPLVVSGDEIVWIVGERISNNHRVTSETKRFLTLIARPLE